MPWRKLRRSLASLVACRNCSSVLVALVISVCTLSLFITRDTSMDNWQSRAELYSLRKVADNYNKSNNIIVLNNITSKLTSPTTTISPIVRNKQIRHLFDDRPIAMSYKTNKRHPHLRKLLITSDDICIGRSVDLLIYFNSAWNNFQRRRILRETWASKNTFHNLTIRRLFFLGKPKSARDQIQIRSEASSYGDIVQGDFFDSFQNLSIKALMCFKWINDYCMQAKYVIKADDDIFVNVFKVVEDILPMLFSKNTTVACHFKKNGTSAVVRDEKSKWFVPKDVFPGMKYFPDFCTGYAAIFTSDVIPKLFEASFSAPFIFIDDVYMFGLLPQFFKTLHYIDIKNNCTLNNRIALDQYKHSSSVITYIVANAWGEGNMHAYWFAALSKLSPWASQQARIITLRKHKGPFTLR